MPYIYIKLGVDFEEVREGKVEEDFALTYDRPFTQWKHLFVDGFVEKIVAEMHM